MCLSTESTEFKAKTKEIYWPILKSSLLNGDLSIEDLDLDCPICWDNMSVHESKDEHVDDHRAVILACGHMLGNSCANLGELEICPICRAELMHRHCGHRNKGWVVPGSIEKLNSVPQELSKGGTIPPYCDTCQVEMVLQKLMERLEFIDAASQARKNLRPRKLRMSLRVGAIQFERGDCPDGMNSVLFETPDCLQHELDDFQKVQVQGEKQGCVWYQESFSDVEVQCFALEKPNFAEMGIRAIWLWHLAHGDDSDSDSDEDDEDDYDEDVASWQILTC
ncbi:hypothetical protein FVEN_g5462 [Fusarium venenatum]|uniref:RING-type domain-containing protein n=1 Tax=Fusarium venenatum TaxID=56646 RepID=A0A2L2U248_9HYPO|nr:uncharacterized protein FVRRES_08452 [Fusarium venenatum]KAG8356803.1 hypothetical protein FVEN_g5462 [Fusarium venenatum]KAH6965226.1 hypothetical protein EDB82DRAFT_540419 [Fusarium venenatum]CEI68375.1 unnamed protein product [Fusarium venenatum]